MSSVERNRLYNYYLGTDNDPYQVAEGEHLKITGVQPPVNEALLTDSEAEKIFIALTTEPVPDYLHDVFGVLEEQFCNICDAFVTNSNFSHPPESGKCAYCAFQQCQCSHNETAIYCQRCAEAVPYMAPHDLSPQAPEPPVFFLGATEQAHREQDGTVSVPGFSRADFSLFVRMSARGDYAHDAERTRIALQIAVAAPHLLNPKNYR